jgi:hypothetical protein
MDWLVDMGIRIDDPSLPGILSFIHGTQEEAIDEFFCSLVDNETALESFCNGWKDGRVPVPVPVVYKLLRTAAFRRPTEPTKKLLSDIVEDAIGDWKSSRYRNECGEVMRVLTTWCICKSLGNTPSHYVRCLLLEQLKTSGNVLQAAEEYDAHVMSYVLADIKNYYRTWPALSPRDVLDAASVELRRWLGDEDVSGEPVFCPVETALIAQMTLDRYIKDQDEVELVLQKYPRMSIEAMVEGIYQLGKQDIVKFGRLMQLLENPKFKEYRGLVDQKVQRLEGKIIQCNE